MTFLLLRFFKICFQHIVHVHFHMTFTLISAILPTTVEHHCYFLLKHLERLNPFCFIMPQNHGSEFVSCFSVALPPTPITNPEKFGIRPRETTTSAAMRSPLSPTREDTQLIRTYIGLLFFAIILFWSLCNFFFFLTSHCNTYSYIVGNVSTSHTCI